MFNKHFYILLEILISVHIGSCTADGPNAQGCYQDDPTTPVFSTSPGGYDPSFMNPTLCSSACKDNEYKYGGIQDGQYCFCADTLPATLASSADMCDSPCSDNTTTGCGGSEGLTSVYDAETLMKLTGLQLTADKTEVAVEEVITFTISLEEGNNVNYMMDYGDGEQVTANNASGMTTHKYPMPGQYYVTVYATDISNPENSISSSITITVNQALGKILVDCPRLKAPSESFLCNISMLQGSAVTMLVDKGDGSSGEEYAVAETTYGPLGHSVPQVEVADIQDASLNAVILMAGSVMDREGYIVGFEVYVTTPGSIDFLVLMPSCSSGEFCYSTGNCEATCSASADEMYCTDVYYPSRESCDPGSSPSQHTSSSYTQKDMYTATATAAGYTYVDLLADNKVIKVQAGDVLAFKVSNGALVGYRNATTSETSDGKTDKSAATVDGPWTESNTAHYARAIVSRPATVSIEMVYSLTGNYTVTVTCTDGNNNQASNSTLVIIAEGIGAINITVEPLYWTVNLPVNVTATVINGSSFDITWDFGDATPFETTHENGTVISSSYWKEHTYTQEGTFLITTTASNLVDNETDTQEIYLQYPVPQTFTFSCNSPMVSPPGTVDFTIEFSSSDPLPTNATAIFTWGDGSTTNMAIPNGTSTVPFAYNYTMGGEFNVTVVLSNAVSNGTKEVMVIVYERITGLSVDVSYWAEEYGADFNPAVGEKHDTVSLNSNVSFVVNKVSGTVMGYSFYNGDGTWIQNSTSNIFYYAVTDKESYNFTFYAWNSVQGQSDPLHVTIFAIDMSSGIVIDDFFETTNQNENKTFEVRMSSMTDDMCMVIYYGDETMTNKLPEAYGNLETCYHIFTEDEITFMSTSLQSSQNLTHLFQNLGVYSINATVFSPITEAYSELTFSVTNFPCPKPVMTLENMRTSVTNAVEHLKSEGFRIQTQAIINCTGEINTTKEWKIYSVDSQTGVQNYLINITTLTSKDKSVLYIPTLFLPYGYYKAVYTLSILTEGMDQRYPWVRSLFTYIQIVPSPPLAIIIEGSMSEVLRGVGQMIYLNPGNLSIDPDFPEDKNFNITWTCRRMLPTEESDIADSDTSNSLTIPTVNDAKPTSDGGGCFGTGPGVLKMSNNNEWTLNTSILFGPDMTYKIKIFLHKGTRSATSEVSVKLVNGRPPNIVIKCQSTKICFPIANGLLINPSSRLGVVGECIEDCDEPLEYSWTVYDTGTKAVITDATSYMSETNSRNMALNSGFFGNNTGPNEFHLQLAVKAQNGDGQSRLYLHVNRPPTGGSCTIAPNTGRALLDNFHISCSGWTDPESHEITSFTFYLLTEQIDGKAVISIGGEPSNDVYLPLGTISIYVDIGDKYGATTTVEIATLNPTLPSKEDYDSFLASSFISNLIGGGNQESICQVMLAIASIENSGAYGRPTAPTNGTDEAYDNYKIEVEDGISKMLQAVETITLGTLHDMEMVSATMSTIMGMGADVDRHGKKTSTQILDSLGNILEQNITLTSPQELRSFVQSAIAVMGALTNSIANTLIDDVVLPSDIKYVNEVDYDTDVPDDIDFEMPLTPEGLHRQAIVEDTGYNGNSQIKKVEKVFGQIGQKLLEQLMPNEEPIRVSTENGVSAMFGKFRGENITDQKFTQNETVIIFPDFCVLMHAHGKCMSNDSVGLQTMELPAILESYGKRVNLLSPNTKTLKIELFSDENKPLKIRNLSVPVDLFIPRITENGTMEFPDPTDITPAIKWYELMMYHQLIVENPYSSVNIEITLEDFSAPILIFIRFGKKPTISEYDNLTRIVDIPKKNGTYDLFFTSSEIKNRTGKFYMGVAELNTSNPNSNYNKLGNYTYDMMATNISTKYSIRIYTSGCYYFDKKWETWKGDGCWVHQSNRTMTHCKCNHLTTFGSGFFITPNTVDFDYVFAHASFNDNLTIYLTISITFALFIIMLIWARYKDRKDKEKLGAAPLSDNKPEDKYIYEIMVFTGHKKSAATDSQVYFILSGEDDETEVRHFTDNKRKIFRKGEIDVFVMAVPRPLGMLNYLRLWHDNSGKRKYGSWYLNYVVICDVQTGEKFQFVGNCWFALEEGDGSIDRLIPVAGNEQLTEFGHLFSNNSQKGITENHLWFSVFLRPPRSRFTRVQRVGCCVAFMYLSMLVNAMWYGTVRYVPQGSAFQIGPFSISTQQIGVGLISNIIVFVPNFIIVYFFKKARPRKLRPSRLETALERQRKKDTKDEEDSKNKHQQEQNGDNKSVTGSEVELITEVKVQKEQVHKANKQKKKFTLPWFFRILAWILVFACIGASVFFLWAYGITFGNEKTKRWLISLIISFFTSVLITEPIKLFLVAMLFSAICKKMDDDDDDADEDEEDPLLLADEEYLHTSYTKQRHTKYRPPNPDTLNKAREIRIKEIHMWAILREILGYMLFLWILIVVSYGNRDPNSYYLKQTLEKAFIRQGKDYDFTEMKSTEQFWNWGRDILIPRLHAQNLYNNKPPFGFKGFLNDQVNRMMGHAVMRQIRINRDECIPPEVMENVSHPCSGTFAYFVDEDRGSYDIGWTPLITEDDDEVPVDKTLQAFRYRTAESLDGVPFVGRLDVYSGGGYVFEITGKDKVLQDQFTALQQNNWIDRFTRAVLIEFSVYNTQVNLFGVCVIQLEFVPGGGFFQDYRFDGIRLLQYHDGFGLIILISEIAFVLFILYFTVHELIEVCKDKRRYCNSYWNMAEVCMILLSIAAIVLYVYRMIITNELLDTFNITKGQKYINLQYVYMLDQIFGYFISFTVFIATVKFIKLLRFNKRIGVLSSTLSHAWSELALFGICFLIVFMAFVQLFYLIMSSTSVDFSGFLRTIEYTFSMMLNKFDFAEISRGCPIIGPVAFFIFSLMTSIVLINLFLTIVIKSFEDVAHNIFKQPNDYEIIDFIFHRFKHFVGLGGTAQPLPNTVIGSPPGGYANQDDDNGEVGKLPEKVDHLLKYINDVYFEGKINLEEPGHVKGMFSKKKRCYTDTN